MNQDKQDFLTNVRVYCRRLGVTQDVSLRAHTAWEKLQENPVFGRSRKEALYASLRIAGLTRNQSVIGSMYLYQLWYTDGITQKFVKEIPIQHGIYLVLNSLCEPGDGWISIWANMDAEAKSTVEGALSRAVSSRSDDKTPVRGGFESLTNIILNKARGYK